MLKFIQSDSSNCEDSKSYIPKELVTKTFWKLTINNKIYFFSNLLQSILTPTFFMLYLKVPKEYGEILIIRYLASTKCNSIGQSRTIKSIALGLTAGRMKNAVNLLCVRNISICNKQLNI